MNKQKLLKVCASVLVQMETESNIEREITPGLVGRRVLEF